jgi:hypothetical protein
MPRLLLGGAAGNSVLPEATSALDQLTAVTSHELAEAATDPDINSNVNNGRLGWFDRQRGEIGGIEENNPSAFVRLDGKLVQESATRMTNCCRSSRLPRLRRAVSLRPRLYCPRGSILVAPTARLP